MIKTKKPRSIYELAKIVGRKFPGVFRDVKLLTKHVLIQLTRTEHPHRKTVHPSVSYGAINLWIGI